MSHETPDLKALRRAAELRPGDPTAHAALVSGLKDVGDDPATVVALEAALDTAVGAFVRAWEIEQPELDDSVEAALGRLEASLQDGALGVRIRLVHASLLARRASPERADLGAAACALLDRALVLDGFQPEALFGAATLALQVGRADEVVRWFGAHGVPGADGLALLVVAKLQIGQAREALAAGHEGLREAPDSVLLLNAMASAALALGETDEALTFVSRALALAPGRTDILLNFAATHEQAGRFPAALGVLDGLAEARQLPLPYESWRSALRAKVFGA